MAEVIHIHDQILNRAWGLGTVAHVFSFSTLEAETDKSVSLRSAWFIE